jgi:murein endopeptidase
MRIALLAVVVLLVLAAPAGARLAPRDQEPVQPDAPQSVAVGLPWHGRLAHGVQLPEAGPDFITWDEVRRVSPNRPGRRWGTDRLVVMLETVAREFHVAHPDAAPLLVSDLSRPRGGLFGREYGGLGHASHQNGLDADVMYPRLDRLLRGPLRPDQVDGALAQDLVDRFRRAGAVRLFVGPRLGLRGPRSIVRPLVHHDDHVHVRIANPDASGPTEGPDDGG